MKLNVHVKLDHCKANSSQTDEILVDTKSSQTRKETLIDKTVQTQTNDGMSKEYEEYSCFYCEKKITSELHLLEPDMRIKVHGSSSKFKDLYRFLKNSGKPTSYVASKRQSR